MSLSDDKDGMLVVSPYCPMLAEDERLMQNLKALILAWITYLFEYQQPIFTALY